MRARLKERPLELVRPDSWQPFYELRERGLVPDRSFIRVTLQAGLTLGRAIQVPNDVKPEELDWSLVAAIDTFVIFDGEVTPFTWLRDCASAILSADPACLFLVDAPLQYAPRMAMLKRAAWPRRWIHEHKEHHG